MQFIPTRIHGILDYIVGIVLIASPWLLGFAGEGAAMWIPIILGAGVLVMSLMTDYELGVARVIPMTAHLGVDVIAGIVLAASPWLFGFADVVWVPHVVFGLFAIGSGLMTERQPQRRAMTDIGDR